MRPSARPRRQSVVADERRTGPRDRPWSAGVVTVEVFDAPARVEYIVWNSFSRTPAAATFLTVLDIPGLSDSN